VTPQPSGPEPDQYRDCMSLLATGVTVITTMTADGPVGMTASAVCSLSLEPPLLLVCVRTSLPTHNALQASGHFGVSVLDQDQIDIARRFATPGADRFTGLDLRAELPVPVLRPAIAYFSCAVAERFPGGDHSIFTGRVLACGHQPGRRPLLYFGRRFGALEDPEQELLRSWSEFGSLV
jgi:flavin reductase (DIM6/NTAB) family NADH-FMN oxidoreductase RutF